MAAGKVGKMALSAIAKGADILRDVVPRVDLGDVTRPLTESRIRALREMVPEVGPMKIVGRKNKRLSEMWDEDVYELDPKKFTETYKVGHPYKEAKNWDELSELDDYWEGPVVRYDVSDVDSSDIAAMTDDIELRGIQMPVVIDRKTGEILDGHHRVMAARDTGRKIPFRFV